MEKNLLLFLDCSSRGN